MNPIDLGVSAVKAVYQLGRKVYGWLVRDALQRRGEDAARDVPTASVLRGSRTKLRWYQWPAARELQREGRGTISGGYYETWVNVTPPGILMAMAMRERV